MKKKDRPIARKKPWYIKTLFILGIIVIFFGLILCLGLILNDKSLVITNYEYQSDEITDDLDGIQILQITDLHNHSPEYTNTNLFDEITEIDPDIVLLTGDFLDKKDTSLERLTEFVEFIKTYPTYYVNGNHEATAPLYYQMLTLFSENGIKEINDKKSFISFGTSNINILGLCDPSFRQQENYMSINDNGVDKNLKDLTNDLPQDLTILLSHRPELMSIYKKYGIDMAFSGHTHGGQIVLFGMRPFFSPNQGLFPYYSRGVYTEENTTMYLSAGLGNSSLDIRIGAPFELLVVTLKKAE